ncbi:MAG: MXAN_5187 C-terminal domain-containing protein [Gemmatimonadota bacterium]
MDTIKDELDRLESEIEGVKRQYDLFFQGNRRSEPSEERRNVEWMVRRMGQRRIINTSDQFRFHGLQSRFYSLFNLWSRMIRDLEEGRLTRDAAGTLVRGAAADDGPVDPAHLDQVLGELRAARADCGLPAGDADIALIRRTLTDRAGEIARKSGAKKVEFRVSVEDGKPKVKAVMR